MARVNINGRVHDLDGSTASYEEICSVLGKEPDDVYTMTWRRPDGSNGTLGKGQAVTVYDGTIFSAALTTRA